MSVAEWRRGRTLGQGSTATVWLATSPTLSSPFAVKTAVPSGSGILQREQRILSSLSSPYVVSYIGFHASDSGEYNLFMEYAPGGSLADEISVCGGCLDEKLIRSRARDVLCGLAYIHAEGVVHCDIKARNVLIGADGRAMLGDLGCAKLVDEQWGRTVRGTPLFMAPEVARGDEQGPECDIWAVGCTVIEMATGKPPWPESKDPVSAVHRIAFGSDLPEIPNWLSQEGKDFLDKCLKRDSKQRWTAEQLLEHPFVSECDSKSSSKDKWISPKSVLDQAAFFWDSIDNSESPVGYQTSEFLSDPSERIRDLATGCGGGVLNWTCEEGWITVRCSSSNNNLDDEATDRIPVNDGGQTGALLLMPQSVVTTSSSSSNNSITVTNSSSYTSDCDGAEVTSPLNVLETEDWSQNFHLRAVIIDDRDEFVEREIRLCNNLYLPCYDGLNVIEQLMFQLKLRFRPSNAFLFYLGQCV